MHSAFSILLVFQSGLGGFSSDVHRSKVFLCGRDSCGIGSKIVSAFKRRDVTSHGKLYIHQ